MGMGEVTPPFHLPFSVTTMWDITLMLKNCAKSTYVWPFLSMVWSYVGICPRGYVRVKKSRHDTTDYIQFKYVIITQCAG